MTAHLRIHTQKQGMIPGVYPEAFQFPGGEWHLRNIPDLPGDQGQVTLIADVRGADPNDLVKAALWQDVADRGNWGPSRLDADFVLILPYMPAARADRGTPMGVSVYARLIRAIRPNKVVILDPHSEQTNRSLVLANVKLASHNALIQEALAVSDFKYNGLICPDKGARERVESTARFLGVENILYFDKQRDFDTGRLDGIQLVEGKVDPWGCYLVVDDICDGGGTFAMLADATGLKREQLGLWVTHGIFSGNAHNLRQYYQHILTTDSHPGSNNPAVATTIIPCFIEMLKAARLRGA